MSRYKSMFNRLEQEERAAFIPFTVLGDPSEDKSFDIIQAMIRGGADALELGLPFSDPLADGPTIQRAVLRAFDAGFDKPRRALALIAKVRQQYPDIPIGILTYANLLHAAGYQKFMKDLADSGVDSVLVADVPTLEVEPFSEAASAAGLDLVMIAPPNATSVQLQIIANHSKGYTYVVTRYGVTGADQALELNHKKLLDDLKILKAPPAIMGFGISSPDSVKQAVESGASGAISGSALVALIEKHLENPTQMIEEIESQVKAMKAAT